MTPKLLIVTDLGSLKAYELGTSPRGTPRLELLEKVVLADAHQRVVDKVTDLSGRRAATAVGSWGAPLSDDHNLKLETKRRLTKQICQHIRRLRQQYADGEVWLAAHKGINRLICDSLPAPVRDQIELNLTRDLVNADKSELLATFGPLLTSARPQPRPRR